MYGAKLPKRTSQVELRYASADRCKKFYTDLEAAQNCLLRRVNMLWWLLLLPSVLGWNLTGLVPHEVPLGQVVLWRNRAYLSVPRLQEDTVPYTLLEAPWPQNSQMILQPRAYPSSGPAAHEEGHCPALQNVTALDIDSARARLWVLDTGTRLCGPKVVAFDLRRNQEVLKVQIEGIEPTLLSSIVVDPMLGTSYVGGNGSFLLAVGPQGDWKQVELSSSSQEKPNTATLAMSRQALYLTSPNSHYLHVVDPSALRTATQTESIDAKCLGSKLGQSRGLVADWKGGLSYFLPRDHVVVRWDTKKPLIAEHHSVLHQSAAALPKVSHLLLDRYPGSALWAVVHQHCVRVHKFSLF